MPTDPDAIVVLSASLKQRSDGTWASTELTAEDNAIGAPGGILRVYAAAALSKKFPSAKIIASGGVGYDFLGNTATSRPLLSDVLSRELIEAGVEVQRIVPESKSNSTYQQLTQLEVLMDERSWRSVILVTNRWHVLRVLAMLKMKKLKLLKRVVLVGAEDVLIEADKNKWSSFLDEAYESKFLKERIRTEEKGIAQIEKGTYIFK